MTTLFRAEMFALALAFLIYIFRTVRKNRLQMRFSVIWIGLALAMMVMALCPGLIFALTALVGMEVPANLLYLGAIFLLLVLSFSHTVQLSAQSERLKSLVQQISLENYFREGNRHED